VGFLLGECTGQWDMPKGKSKSGEEKKVLYGCVESKMK